MLSANAKELRQTTSISFIFPPIIDRFQAHTHPCPWAKGQTDRSQSPRLVVWKRNIVDAKYEREREAQHQQQPIEQHASEKRAAERCGVALKLKRRPGQDVA
ncbi:unnamed protein product [Toxocara canis]|uniref:Uncharacterized protein n=1 Tax=Toxocara canis TaxID=6265 RepID=A0A183U083_TOXCA|nr:unnamed protein product [Toxocara canis]